MVDDLMREKYRLAVLFLDKIQRRLSNGKKIFDTDGVRLRSTHEVVNAILAGKYPAPSDQ